MAENTDIKQKKEMLKDVHTRSLEMANETRPEDVPKLSPSKCAKRMKYYSGRMNPKIKENFSHKIDHGVLNLSNKLPKKSGTIIGTKWHSALQAYLINSKNIDKTIPFKNTKDVVDKIEEKFEGFKFIRGKLHLSGYMVKKINQSDISFWAGEADAIGTYKGKYVIVDWKVVKVEIFWEKNCEAYGLYLHQCLVYARLLQLHLVLDYLPHIMIVAIDNTGSTKIHPSMFTDYPKECKDKFKEYAWSIEKPVSVIPKNMINESLYTSGQRIPGTDKICSLFTGDVTVDDIQILFGLQKFMVEEDEEESDEQSEESKASEESEESKASEESEESKASDESEESKASDESEESKASDKI